LVNGMGSPEEFLDYGWLISDFFRWHSPYFLLLSYMSS
jgi:hypothetical protein